MAEDNNEFQKKAAEVGFDLTKQFLTLALAGIAFVVGLSFNTPGAISDVMLWTTVGVFGLSSVLGLMFLMCGVGQMSTRNSYDIYATSLRILAGFQIITVLIGVILLIPILRNHPNTKKAASNVEIKADPQHNTVIEIDGNKVRITSSKN